MGGHVQSMSIFSVSCIFPFKRFFFTLGQVHFIQCLSSFLLLQSSISGQPRYMAPLAGRGCRLSEERWLTLSRVEREPWAELFVGAAVAADLCAQLGFFCTDGRRTGALMSAVSYR